MAMKVEAARLMVYSAAACGVAGLGFISAASKCLASDAKITQIYLRGYQSDSARRYVQRLPAMRRMQLPTHQPKARPSVFRSGVGGVAELGSGAEGKSIRLPVTRVGVARTRGVGH